MNEHEDAKAAELLEVLARDPTHERWHILSMCQLWGLRLKQGKEKEAELLFRSLAPRYRIGELSLFLPDHVREGILSYYRTWYRMGLAHLIEHANHVASLERSLEVEEFFATSREQQQLTRFYLFALMAKAAISTRH